MSALKKAYAQGTSEGGGRNFSKMPRKKISFTVDHSLCMPDVFESDFEITLQSLTSRAEMKAARDSKGDPTAMAFLMAKASIVAVDGEAVDETNGEDEFLWEALDQGGRQLVVSMFAKVGTPDDDSAGKAEASLKVH